MPDLPDERGRGGGGGERAGGQRGKDARNMGERPAPGPYTVVNLKQVEDQAPKHGLSPGLESRFARVALELHASGLSYFRIAPDFRQPFGHRHRSRRRSTWSSAAARERRSATRPSSSAPGTLCVCRPPRCGVSRAAPRAPRSSPSARPATTTATSRPCRSGGPTEAALTEARAVSCGPRRHQGCLRPSSTGRPPASSTGRPPASSTGLPPAQAGNGLPL